MKTPNLSLLCILACALGLALAGCTQVTVAKVPAPTATGAPDEKDHIKGIRYSLPKPFVQMTPQADGSVVADIILLPDAENTYAVDAKSYLASHSLTVGTTEKGLLKKIVWTGNSAAVAAQGVTSAAAIGENLQSKANEDNKAAQTAAQAKLDAATKQVTDAKLALDLAESDAAVLYATYGAAAPSNDDVVKVESTREQARIKYAAAVDQLALLKSKGAVANVPTGNGPGDAPPSGPIVYGPLLYAVNETKAGLSLNAVTAPGETTAAQRAYPVVDLPQDEAEAPDFLPGGLIAIQPDKSKNMVLTLTASGPILELHRTDSKFIRKTEKSDAVEILSLPPISNESSTLFKVTLTGLPPGDYELTLDFTWLPAKRRSTHKVELRILPLKS